MWQQFYLTQTQNLVSNLIKEMIGSLHINWSNSHTSTHTQAWHTYTQARQKSWIFKMLGEKKSKQKQKPRILHFVKLPCKSKEKIKLFSNNNNKKLGKFVASRPALGEVFFREKDDRCQKLLFNYEVVYYYFWINCKCVL